MNVDLEISQGYLNCLQSVIKYWKICDCGEIRKIPRKMKDFLCIFSAAKSNRLQEIDTDLINILLESKNFYKKKKEKKICFVLSMQHTQIYFKR